MNESGIHENIIDKSYWPKQGKLNLAKKTQPKLHLNLNLHLEHFNILTLTLF